MFSKKGKYIIWVKRLESWCSIFLKNVPEHPAVTYAGFTWKMTVFFSLNYIAYRIRQTSQSCRSVPATFTIWLIFAPCYAPVKISKCLFLRLNVLKNSNSQSTPKVAYFAGYSAGYLFPEVGKSAVRILEQNGISVGHFLKNFCPKRTGSSLLTVSVVKCNSSKRFPERFFIPLSCFNR